MNNIQESKKLLEEMKPILTSLDLKTKNESFDKVILDLTTMINEVISTFDENDSSNTNNKMKTLGEHVNLLLYRGELVLSGIKFET